LEVNPVPQFWEIFRQDGVGFFVSINTVPGVNLSYFDDEVACPGFTEFHWLVRGKRGSENGGSSNAPSLLGEIA
jgi:hypothetical protein